MWRSGVRISPSPLLFKNQVLCGRLAQRPNCRKFWAEKSIYTKEYQAVLNQLKKARLESDLKQEEVAKILKKPQSYISKVERGEKRLDVAELKKIADIYKKTLNYFVK